MARYTDIDTREGDDQQRVLSVDVRDEDHGAVDTYHINVDNVSYLRISRGALTRTGAIAVIAIAAVVGFLLSAWDTAYGLVGFVVTGVAVFAALQVEDLVEIGTTAQNHVIDAPEDRLDAVRSGFVDLAEDLASLTQDDVGPITLVAVIVGLVLAILDLWLGLLGGVAIGVGLYLLLPAELEEKPARATVEPTASRNDLEEAFLELQEEVIAIERTDEDLLRRYNYRYYFVPDNVVSIAEAEESPFWLKVLLAAAALTGLAALVSLLGGELVDVLIFAVLCVIALLIAMAISVRTWLSVRTHGDVQRVFEMTPEDAERLLQEFNTRG